MVLPDVPGALCVVLASLHGHLHVSTNTFIRNTQFQLKTGIFVDTTIRMNLTLFTTVGPRTLSTFSSAYSRVPFCFIRTFIAHVFQLRDCAPGYGSVWSRLWEISGDDRNAHI